ncbi:Hypothetical protein BC94_0551 [Mycoplasmopsis bovis]|uniref:Uncharacterized protein n=1 Tax=Mycoplasmopsis bovis TaxID=28903 RepID=A0A8D4D1S1_MYCBV|nr:Hypothetical protein BC85_0548 [Mycoplasmopsis bovis]AMW25815.1 Hypothetical protein BC94_0551 [Mycoplasmopsis bovis]AMW26446.1 Hypothetical protein BC93_0548 [Mycoplasmopsis bovis]
MCSTFFIFIISFKKHFLVSSPDLYFSYFSNKYFHSLTLNCLAIFISNKKTSANLLMSTFFVLVYKVLLLLFIQRTNH